VLRDLLDRPQEAAAIAQRGRDVAASRYTLQGMLARYEFAFAEMVRRDAVPGLHHPMVA
jgi:hypothetical protein